jgi:hypothetical protein
VDLYWNWSKNLEASGWGIPPSVAERYDAALDEGDHQKAGAIIERYRPHAQGTGSMISASIVSLSGEPQASQ